MSRLARLPYTGGNGKSEVVAFGNVNYAENFAKGDFRETMNVSSASYPSVIPRAGRETISQEDGATAVYYFGGLGKVVGNNFYWDGYTENEWKISPGEKQFAKVGNTLCIYPDKAYFVLPDADHPHGQFTPGVNSEYIIPLMLPFRMTGKRIIFPYSESESIAQYTRIGNGETVSGRGKIALNSVLYVSEDYDGAPISQVVIQSYDTIIRHSYGYVGFESTWRIYPYYDPEHPDSTESKDWYYIVGIYGDESTGTGRETEAVYWNEGEEPITRKWWKFEIGKIPYAGSIPTNVRTMYGWNYVNPTTDTVYSTEINQYYDGKYIDDIKVGDIVSYNAETGIYLLAESVKRIPFGFTEGFYPSLLMYERGGETYISDDLLDHWFVEIETGEYTALVPEEPFVLNLSSLNSNTEVSLIIGDKTVNAVYMGNGSISGSKYIEFANGNLSNFVRTTREYGSRETVIKSFGAVTMMIKDTTRNFDYVCSAGNRLWGVSGNMIYASKFGDPTDFTSADFISSDPWKTEVGSDGEWTGIVEYSGNVYCFKEDVVHVVLGSLPENYRVYTYNFAGIKSGFSKSAVVVNEVLYYYGVEGVYRYGGNTPVLISKNFGLNEYERGTAGTDGVRYYISLKKDEKASLMCFDIPQGIWLRQDSLNVIDFTRSDGLYALDTDGSFIKIGITDSRGYDDNMPFDWSVLTVPYRENSFDVKYNHKILIRIEAYADTEFAVSVIYDGNTEKEVFHKEALAEHKVYTIPIIPQRCDEMQIRIFGSGNFILRGIEKHFAGGTHYAKH